MEVKLLFNVQFMYRELKTTMEVLHMLMYVYYIYTVK